MHILCALEVDPRGARSRVDFDAWAGASWIDFHDPRGANKLENATKQVHFPGLPLS